MTAIYTSVLASFYFVCYLPYWAENLHMIIRPRTHFIQNESFVYYMYIIHALPFVNSSFNWVFHLLLSTQVRLSDQKLSKGLTTFGKLSRMGMLPPKQGPRSDSTPTLQLRRRRPEHFVELAESSERGECKTRVMVHRQF